MCELQGGPYHDHDVRHDVAFNEWGSLNDSPQMWAVPTVLLIPAPSLDNKYGTNHALCRVMGRHCEYIAV